MLQSKEVGEISGVWIFVYFISENESLKTFCRTQFYFSSHGDIER